MTERRLEHLADMMEEASDYLSTVDGVLAWDLAGAARRLRSCTATVLVGDRYQLALPGVVSAEADSTRS